MRRSRALPWALALLDDGLRLYRRHLAGFLLVSTAVMVPLAVLSGCPAKQANALRT